MSEIRKIGVVGAGTMGHGIAQVAAQSGYDVKLVDVSTEALERGWARRPSPCTTARARSAP
jgi:3-hydroxybutyryl-CoA dehydrogenase